jgi:hypothetical protein
MADQFHSWKTERKTKKYKHDLAHVTNIALFNQAIWERLWKYDVDTVG